MIDALIAGKIYGAPQQRTGKNGSAFVTAKARCASGEGDGVFINVIAFDAETCHALMALEDGDAVSMAGTLTPGHLSTDPPTEFVDNGGDGAFIGS
jgi:hypothetical protein